MQHHTSSKIPNSITCNFSFIVWEKPIIIFFNFAMLIKQFAKNKHSLSQTAVNQHFGDATIVNEKAKLL